MPISMSSRANYVTQSSIWSNQFLGPLTNRKIAKYQKEGRIGSTPFVREAMKLKRKTQTRKQSTKKTMKIFSGF